MLILAVRTDSELAQVVLLNEDTTEISRREWTAGRELAITLLENIDAVLQLSEIEPTQISAIVFYKGPGSFTALRIGAAVVNSLAYALGVPLIASMGDNWLASGTALLKKGENDKVAIPEYGAPAHITM